MKLRRIFALLCVIALALSLSFPAFAAVGGTDQPPLTGDSGIDHPPAPEEQPGSTPEKSEHMWDSSFESHMCVNPDHFNPKCEYWEPTSHVFVRGVCSLCGYLEHPFTSASAISHEAPFTVAESDPATWVIGQATTSTSANVYSAPSPASATNTVLTANTSVPVLDWANNNGFIKVSVEGSVCYVKSFVFPVGIFPAGAASARKTLHVKPNTAAAVFVGKNLSAAIVEFLLAGTPVYGVDLGDGWFQRSSDGGYIWSAALE